MLYWKDKHTLEAAAMDGTQRSVLIDYMNQESIGLAIDTDGM